MSILCSATTKAGAACPNRAMPDQTLCFSHLPQLSLVRHEGRVRGGYGKRNENRAMKRMPTGIKDTLDVLYRTLSGLEEGTVEPARATAIAAVTRAIVTTFEAGQVEARLADIERKIAE